MSVSAPSGQGGSELVEYVCPRCEKTLAAEDAVCPHCGQELDLLGDAVAAPAALAGWVYAGWWRRLSAWLLDWIILMTLASVVSVPLAITVGETSGDTVVSFLLLPFYFAYFALLNGRGQTLGKRALGIRVVDAKTGEPIGGGRGAAREAIRLACSALLLVPFMIDGLRPLWNGRHQSWHDSAARSIVVRDR